MIKKTLIAFALLSLTACNQNQGYDGYVFGKKQYEKDALFVTVVVDKSEAEFRQDVKNHVRGVDPANIAAFSLITPNSDVCEIHMLDPAVSYQPEFIGHEFLHCVYGQWHTDNQSRG